MLNVVSLRIVDSLSADNGFFRSARPAASESASGRRRFGEKRHDRRNQDDEKTLRTGMVISRRGAEYARQLIPTPRRSETSA